MSRDVGSRAPHPAEPLAVEDEEQFGKIQRELIRRSLKKERTDSPAACLADISGDVAPDHDHHGHVEVVVGVTRLKSMISGPFYEFGHRGTRDWPTA